MCLLAGFAGSHSYSPSSNLIPRVNAMKLLHIDSSVLGPHSVSRQVSAAIVDRLRKVTPNLGVVYRDLTLTPLAHLSGPHLAAGQGAVPEAALQQDLAAGQAVLDEFLAAGLVATPHKSPRGVKREGTPPAVAETCGGGGLVSQYQYQVLREIVSTR